MADALTHARAALMRLYAHGRTPDPAVLIEHRRVVATETIARDIRKTLAAFPPLTDEQQQRLIDLIKGR